MSFMKASNVIAPKNAAKAAPDLEEAIEEEEVDPVKPTESAEAQEDDDLDIKGDKYIKQPKAKGGRRKSDKAGKDDEDGNSEAVNGSKSSGKAKAASGGAKGRKKK